MTSFWLRLLRIRQGDETPYSSWALTSALLADGSSATSLKPWPMAQCKVQRRDPDIILGIDIGLDGQQHFRGVL